MYAKGPLKIELTSLKAKYNSALNERGVMAHNNMETSDTHFFGVGLYNTKNGFNIGASIRAVGNFGGDFFVVSGNRFNEHHANQGHRKSDFRNTDTEQVRKKIPVFLGVNDLMDYVPYDTEIVVLERSSDAVSISEFSHPRRAFYIFGPEDGAVPDSIVSKAHHKVFIPTVGSMNMAHAVVATLCDRVCKGITADKTELKCPKCGNIYYKKVAEGVLHCNACGHEGPHLDWDPT